MSRYEQVIIGVMERLEDPPQLTEADKTLILRLLKQELQKERRILEHRAATARSGSKWTEEDIAALKYLLGNRKAMSFAEQRANLAEATALMKRSSQSVKNKCIEIGLRRAVDHFENILFDGSPKIDEGD